MQNEIKIGQIYESKNSAGVLRRPFCIHGSFVYYEVASIEEPVFNKDNTTSWSVTEFLKNNEPYEPPKQIETAECIWMEHDKDSAVLLFNKDKVKDLEKSGWKVVKVKVVEE